MGENYKKSLKKWLKTANKNTLILPKEITFDVQDNKLINSHIFNIQKLRDITFPSSVNFSKNMVEPKGGI